MIILNVTYTCKPGMRQAYLDALHSEGLDQACRDEEGNIKYDYYLSETDPDEILLVEKWRDAEILAVHMQTAHFKRIGEIKSVYVDKTVLEKLVQESEK